MAATLVGFDDPGKPKTTLVGFDSAPPTQAPTQQGVTSGRLALGAIADSDMENYMANNQSKWELLGKGLTQTVSEAVLGTIEGSSYLLDFEQMVDKLKGAEGEYTNWLAESMKKAKQSVAGATNVYQTAEAQTGFAPGDATWWAKNTPQTIGTALSLMIPAGAVAGGAGKLANILGRGAEGVNLTRGLSATVASRYMESTMEANNMYERAFEQLMTQPGMTEEQAKLQAGKQASNVWNSNWVFAVQDFMQYNSILKGFGTLAKGKKGFSMMELAKQMASEAGEEAGQYIVGEEGYRAALNPANEYFGVGFKNRLSDYLDNPEFKASALLGAVGGGVFSAAGQVANVAADKGESFLEPARQAAEYLKNQASRLTKRGLQKEAANYASDTATSQAIDDVTFAEQVAQHLEKGSLPTLKKEYEELSSQPGLDQDGRETIKKKSEDLDWILGEEGRLKSSGIPVEVHPKMLFTKLEQINTGRLVDTLTKDTDKLIQTAVQNKELAPEFEALKRIQTQMEGYRELARTNPQFGSKVASTQAEFNRMKQSMAPMAAALELNIDEQLATTSDQELFTKTMQLISTREKLTDIKKDIAKYNTKEGIAQLAKEETSKKVNETSRAVLLDPKATKEEILQAAANTQDQALQIQLANKHRAIVDSEKEVKEQDVKGVVESENIPDELTLLEDESIPDSPLPDFDESMPDVSEEINPDEFEIPEVEEAPVKVTKEPSEDTASIIRQVNAETEVKTVKPISERAKKKEQVQEKIKETKTVPAWLKEVNNDGSKTQYTNNITNQTATADQIFATDKHGNLLGNTPLVAVGQKVTLKVENDFPWVLTPGFKPTSVDNQVINVYVEGVQKPIKQLPSADNPKNTAEAKSVIKKLRDAVIAKGTLETTIVGKNIGTQRVAQALNSLEALESDYTNTNGTWELNHIPHNPVLGVVDFNGNVVVERAAAMQGMDDKFIERLNAVQMKMLSADLRKMAGNAVTFRTSPDGSLRITALDARVLSEAEAKWVTDNIVQLINEDQLERLGEVLHLQVSGTGVLDSKSGTKIPDLHTTLSRRRIHLIKDTENLGQLLIPVQSQGNKGWVSIETKVQLGNFLSGKAATISYLGVENGAPVRSVRTLSAPDLINLRKKFDKILANSFKNISKNFTNSEIQYTDPVTGTVYPNGYYEYLTKTDSLLTNLPGSKTLGAGEDSSYSYNQAAIYLDPSPEAIERPSTPSIETEAPVKEEPKIPEAPKAPTKKRGYRSDKLGPKLKLATDGSFNILGDKEIQWFKDHIGESHLTIAKGVDRFVAGNGLQAYGQYYNHLVTLAEYSPAGTAYHEALHFFADPANGLVTKKQSEVINAIGEEKLAREFELYKLSNGSIAPRSEKVEGFFSKLIKFIKGLFGLKGPVEKLFADIDAVQPKNIKISNSEASEKYRLLPGFQTYRAQEEAVQGFTSEVMRVVHVQARESNEDLINIFKSDERRNNIFDNVKNFFAEDAGRIKNTPEEQWSDTDNDRYLLYLAMGVTTDESFPEFQGTFENIKSEGGFPVEGFKTKVLKDLSRFGFITSVKDVTEYEDDDAESQRRDELTDQGNSEERIYDVDHTEINPTKSISQRVKLFLSTIPEPGGEKTIFGTDKYINFKWVDVNLTQKLVDSIDPLVTLSELAVNDPLTKAVYDALINEKNKGNIQLYNEFLVKYHNNSYHKDSFILGYDDKIDMDGSRYREYYAQVLNTDQNTADKALINRWREEAVRKKIVDSQGIVNKNKANSLANGYQGLIDRWFNSKKTLAYKELKSQFISYMGEFGVTIPEQLWKEIEARKDAPAKLQAWMFGLRENTLQQLMINYREGKDPFEGSNIISVVAKRSGVYENTPSNGAYLNEKGKQEYPNNTPSYITEFFNDIEQNPKDVLNYYKQDAFFNDNEVLKLVAEAARPGGQNTQELKFVSALRLNGQEAKSFEERTDTDTILTRLAAYANNDSNSAKIFVGTPSDKTKQPTVTLPKKKTNGKDFLASVLYNTMQSEVVRINRIRKFTERKDGVLPSDIKNLKNATKFMYIPQLDNVLNLTEAITSGKVNSAEYLEARKQARQVIDDFAENQYQKFISYLADNDIVTRTKDTLDNARTKIPKGILKGKTVDAFLREFFYNDFAWRLELSKLLQGDIALYSSADDYFKRQYQLVTPGYKGYSDTSVTITRGIYPKQMKVNNEATLAELAQVASREVANKYKDVNKTDAQSLMTIDSFRTLANSLGQWSKTHEEVYQLAWSKGLSLRQAIKQGNLSPEESKRLFALNVTIQPFKPFQFNNREIRLPDGSTMIIKEQFKDSITPITPELASVHKGYNDLLGFMKANKIDIMSAEDTTKVGLYGVITDVSQPVQDWQKRSVALEDFRFPQLIPDKKKEEVSLSQLAKLILGNVKDNKKIALFNDLWADKIKQSSDSLLSELGVGADLKLSDDQQTRRDQIFKLHVVLKRELSSRDLNENYSDVLELVNKPNGTDFSLPLSFPAFGQRFQTIISNLWKKNVITQKSAGYSAVNLADFGVGYSDELKFVTKSNGTITEAEIGLPIDPKEYGLKYGEHILPNGDIMWDKLDKDQQESLQFILYRIPTSNKSSMVPVRVKKILPKELNNVVMIPGELTIQQGLDFDVDKSQLLRRVLDKKGKIDEKDVDTQLFNLYWSILTDPAHGTELITPLATTQMEAKLQEYRDKGLVDLDTESSVFTTQADAKAEIRNKDGKKEIGIASRFNTGHAIIQSILDYTYVNASIDIEVGEYKFNKLGREKDSNGTYISENYGETQQAALDAAKNPLLAYFNVVKDTMAAFETMIGFGVPLPITGDFFMQPVLREWTKFYKQENQNEKKATEKLFARYPSVKAQVLILERDGMKSIPSSSLNENLTKAVDTDNNHSARILMEFLKVQELGKQMTKINNVLSIDTTNDLAGIEALQAVRQQIQDATNDSKSVYIDKRIFNINTTPEEGKRLAAFYKYGIENGISYLGNFYPAAFKYDGVKNYYAEVLGQNRLTDKDTIKDINQFTDYFNLQKDASLFRKLQEIHPSKDSYTRRWSFFDVDKSIWNHINSMVAKYPQLNNNELIRNLASEKSKGGKVQLIGTRNTNADVNKNEIIQGWGEVLNAENAEIRGLGHDLVRFAIQTSGFKYGTKSFFDLIPVDFWVQNSFGDLWNQKTQGLVEDRESAVIQYIRSNFANLKDVQKIYGFFKGNKFESSLIKSYKSPENIPGRIVEFVLAEENAPVKLPRFYRMNVDEVDRLYESDPNNPLSFKEVQPLGDRNYVEIGATGREVSNAPVNSLAIGSAYAYSKPNPFGDGSITKAYSLTGDTEADINPFVRDYLKEDKNDAESVLKLMLAQEVDVEAKKGLQVLLNNVNKINTPIVLEGMPGKLGSYEVKETGVGIDSVIKINPQGKVRSEAEMRVVLHHELRHAYFTGIIQNPTAENQIDFVRNLDRLRKDVINRAGKVKGTEDLHEFNATLGSDPEFRALARKNGIWDRFIRNIRKLFGFKDSYDAILEQSYQLIDKIERIQSNPGEFNLTEVTPPQKKLSVLEKILEVYDAKAARLKRRGFAEKAKETGVRIKDLEELQQVNRAKFITEYLIDVTTGVKEIKETLEKIKTETDPSKLNPKVLYGIREQLLSYNILDVLKQEIRSHTKEYFPDEAAMPDMKVFNELRGDIKNLQEDLRSIRLDRTSWKVKSVVNTPMTQAEIRNQLEIAERGDLTTMNYLLDPGTQTSDEAVQAIHRMVKDAHAESDRSVFNFLNNEESKPVKVNYETLEPNSSGVGMHYQKRVYDYKSISGFKALNEYETWLKTQGKNPNSLRDKFNPILNQNSFKETSDGVEFVSPTSKEGRAILSIKEGSKDYPLRQFYENFVLAYLKSQEGDPRHLRPGLRIPTIARKFFETLISEKGLSKGLAVTEAIRQDLQRKYDENERKAVNEENKLDKIVPVRFIARQDGVGNNMKKEEVSLDIATTIAITIGEASLRNELDKVQADAELIKSALEERQVVENKKNLSGPGISGMLMREKAPSISKRGELIKIQGDQSNSYKMAVDMLDRLVYGQFKKDEGTVKIFGKDVDVRSGVNAVLKYSGLRIMLGNLAIPATNLVMGEAAALKEAIGGNLINKTQWSKGQKFYFAEALPAWYDLANRQKKTKFGKFMLWLNPIDKANQVEAIGIDSTKTRALWTNIMNGSLVESKLVSNVVGAVVERFPIIDKEGKSVSFYHGVEVSPSGVISLKPGHKYKGSLSLSKEDINEVRNYVLNVYQEQNGIYNRLDSPIFKASSVGALVLFMRNWLRPGFRARWQMKRYSPDLKQEIEGHYISALVAFNNIFHPEDGWLTKTANTLQLLTWMGVKDPNMLLLPNELDLNQPEKDNLINVRQANIRKALFELYVTAALAILIFSAFKDDDDSYTKMMLARMRRELLTFVSPSTAWDVLQSPTVALRTVKDIGGIMWHLIDAPADYLLNGEVDVYKQGKYKGEQKWKADLKKAIPIVGQLKQFDDIPTATRLILQGNN